MAYVPYPLSGSICELSHQDFMKGVTIMFQILSEIPLPGHCSTRYRGLAYDGCWFYLTRDCAREVEQTDRCGQLLDSFETCRCYSCLCYDPRECCFWAASDHCPFSLFKLDTRFREIDCLRLRTCASGLITGLSFQCCTNRLLVAFATGIALIDKDGSPVWEQKEKHWTKGVLSLCPYFVTWSLVEDESVVRLYNRAREVVATYPLPCGTCVEAAVLDPCENECGHCVVYLLVTKRGCYPYLLRCVPNCDCLCKHLCPCNFTLCHNKPCTEKTHACNDVLESIALMEAALSHILNAEGEKLQRIIATTDDPCVLLEVNKSVNTTLINATHLEQVLFHKLESIKEVCDCHPPKGCTHAPGTE